MIDCVRRCLLAVGYRVVEPIDRRVSAGHERDGASAFYGGLKVAIDAPEAGQDGLQRTINALRLIERYDPVRWARVRRGLERILVTGDMPTMYLPGIRGCYVALETVTREDARVVAMAIVHEATHARVWARGFRSPKRHHARQIERLCVREELLFAKKVPKSEAFVAWAEERLAGTDGAATSSMETVLRGRGVHRWLIALRRWLMP